MSAAPKFTPTIWRIGPGDPRMVFLPGVVKPINCGNTERARVVAVAPNMLLAIGRVLGSFTNDAGVLFVQPDVAEELRAIARFAALTKAEGRS